MSGCPVTWVSRRLWWKLWRRRCTCGAWLRIDYCRLNAPLDGDVPVIHPRGAE